jgi:hypothetical protein
MQSSRRRVELLGFEKSRGTDRGGRGAFIDGSHVQGSSRIAPGTFSLADPSEFDQG